jgi:uncharacterized membrane protein YgcG
MKNTYKQLQRIVGVLLSALLALSLTTLYACGTKAEVVTDALAGSALNAEGLDSRASAADTFGSNVDGIEQGGQQLTNAASVQRGSEVYDIEMFMTAFYADRDIFVRNLTAALSSTYPQEPGAEIMRFDVLGLIDVFGLLAMADDGPEAMCAYWQRQQKSSAWTYEYADDDGYLDLLLYDNGTPSAEFFGWWDEAGQYLWCQYNTVNSSFEIEVVRTNFGWALQTYDVPGESVYRITFCDTGSPDGGIGFFQGFYAQPRALESGETIDLPTQWTEYGESAQGIYIVIDGNLLKVRPARSDEQTYQISSGGNGGGSASNGGGVSGSNGSSGGSGSSGSTGSLSAQAQPYARLWHGNAVLGAGWSERFALADNGTFVWCANQMDGASRLRYLAGYWDIQNGTLVLDCLYAIAWEGGEEKTNNGQYGSYGSSTVILNPTVVLYEIEETLELPVSSVSRDNQRGLDTVTFNQLKCWDYSAQASDALDDFLEALDKAQMNGTETANKDRSTGGRSGLGF